MTVIEEYVISQVKKMREERNMSQAELADLMNVTRGFIGQVENPKHWSKYNLNHINLLAEIFNCSPKDFMPDKPLP